MPNGFGFQMPRPVGTPDPRQVGQMLMQGGQQASPAPQAAEMAVAQGHSDGQPQEFAPMTPEEGLRREGAKLMGGAGNDGALEASVGEALTRAGGGHKGNPNPHKQRGRHMQQLQQLGLTQVEAMLLGETL